MALSSKYKNSRRKSPEELSEMLDALEKLIDRTKVMYEQYFMGIQKMAPTQLHRDIERRMRELTQQQIRNTALRFRLTTLSQKFGSYNTYWKRTVRQIEQGKYVRDIARVQRKAARRGEELPPELLAAMPKRMRDRIQRDRELVGKRAARVDANADRAAASAGDRPGTKLPPGHVHQIDEDSLVAGSDFDLDAMFAKITHEEAAAAAAAAPSRPAANPPAAPPSRPARPARPAAARVASKRQPNARTVGAPPGMSEEKSRQLYRSYLKARSMVGERTDNITYEKLMHSLNKQAPGIMKKHGARGVDFNVVVKGDKVVVKAKPIK